MNRRVRTCCRDIRVSAKPEYASIRNALENGINDEQRKRDADTDQMLHERETLRVKREESASELNDQEIHDNYDHPNDPESYVRSMGASAWNYLIVDFSRSYHVESLKPEEDVEDKCHMARFISIYTLKVYNSVVEVGAIEIVRSSGEYHVILVELHNIPILRET